MNEEYQEHQEETAQPIEVEATKPEESSLGEINIAPDIIATLAALTTMKVEGVSGMAGLPQASLGTIIGRRELNKGVKVDLKDKTVSVEISVIVNIEATIIEVAKIIQREVKRVIEEKTGMTVNKVDINVREVAYSEKEEEIKEEG